MLLGVAYKWVVNETGSRVKRRLMTLFAYHRHCVRWISTQNITSIYANTYSIAEFDGNTGCDGRRWWNKCGRIEGIVLLTSRGSGR